MLTTILSLLGGGLGGLLRFVPEILKLLTEKRDRDHEYRMTELQLKIDQARAAQAIDLVHAQGDVANDVAGWQALQAALAAQGQPTGVPWVDALNQSVRPVVTYWWMALLTAYKVAMTIAAAIELYLVLKAADALIHAGPALTAFGDRIWSPQDAGILSMILGFWFVDRSIRKQQGR